MGLQSTTFWPLLREFVQVQVYDRDGGHRRPRIRIEFKDMPPTEVRWALAVTMPCVACGAAIHPIRERKGGGGLYYACTCPLDVRMGCARGRAAADEYARFRSMAGLA